MKFTKITHLYAAGMAALAVFLATPAGVALLMQYPRLASLISAATIFGIYHAPKATT